MPLSECPCGSGKFPEAVHDARGIFCCYVCDKCQQERLSRFRADIFTDSGYEVDEPIDPDGCEFDFPDELDF